MVPLYLSFSDLTLLDIAFFKFVFLNFIFKSKERSILKKKENELSVSNNRAMANHESDNEKSETSDSDNADQNLALFAVSESALFVLSRETYLIHVVLELRHVIADLYQTALADKWRIAMTLVALIHRLALVTLTARSQT